jgi:hypothetical protein
MLDSDFWRNLAEQFNGAGDAMGILDARWSIRMEQGSSPQSVAQYEIKCGKYTALRAKFEAIACRGGIKLNPAPPPLVAWLEALRHESINAEKPGGDFRMGPQGKVAEGTAFGTIKNLCQASEELCHILESRVLALERVPQSESVAELRKLGLTIDIDENTAARILGGLQIIDGRYFQGHYHRGNNDPRPASRQHLFDAYHVIAKELVNASTSDEVLENMIPSMVNAFRLKEDWWPRVSPETLKRMLQGPVHEWKGKRLLMQTEPIRPGESALSPQPSTPSISKQIDTAEGVANVIAERMALIQAYKRECKEHGIKVTDAMIAQAASPKWNERTPVARWKVNDSRCTAADDVMIRAVLKKKPHLK